MTEELERDRYRESLQASLAPDTVLVTDSGDKPWGQVLLTGRHVAFADTPPNQEGTDHGAGTGPDPHQLVLMALGACTAITMRMYAVRKGWTIERIAVRLSFVKPEPAAPRGWKEQIRRVIELDGPLDLEQRTRLFAIAERCPVHQLLTQGATIKSELGQSELGRSGLAQSELAPIS
jgi:putative redox protein